MNEDGEKVYRRNGHHYVVEPIALVFNDDNYYLMVYSSKHDNTANYRVDRMEKVEIIDDSICDKALAFRDSIGDYTEQAFKMYGGQLQEITIQFENCLIGAVYDKFGENTQMRRISDTVCEATVAVQISPTFWGWIFQFGKLMWITAPNAMINDYRNTIRFLLEKV